MKGHTQCSLGRLHLSACVIESSVRSAQAPASLVYVCMLAITRLHA
jgi:hypothetical protein